MATVKLSHYFDRDGNKLHINTKDVYDTSINKNFEDFIKSNNQNLEALRVALDNKAPILDVATYPVMESLDNVIVGSLCWVADATGDTTVEKGGALYLAKALTETTPKKAVWEKISESESLDVILDWAKIVGKPTSTVTEIDDAVTKKHSHDNKAIIDVISTDADNYLGFNNVYLNKVTGIDERANIATVGDFRSKMIIVREQIVEYDDINSFSLYEYNYTPL